MSAVIGEKCPNLGVSEWVQGAPTNIDQEKDKIVVVVSKIAIFFKEFLFRIDTHSPLLLPFPPRGKRRTGSAGDRLGSREKAENPFDLGFEADSVLLPETAEMEEYLSLAVDDGNTASQGAQGKITIRQCRPVIHLIRS